jgi:hypothetical protein
MVRRILPRSGLLPEISMVRGRLFDRELSTAWLVEAELFLALDLNHTRILDYDLDRAKADATDCVGDTPKDLVAGLRFKRTIVAAIQDRFYFHKMSY